MFAMRLLIKIFILLSVLPAFSFASIETVKKTYFMKQRSKQAIIKSNKLILMDVYPITALFYDAPSKTIDELSIQNYMDLWRSSGDKLHIKFEDALLSGYTQKKDGKSKKILSFITFKEVEYNPVKNTLTYTIENATNIKSENKNQEIILQNLSLGLWASSS